MWNSVAVDSDFSVPRLQGLGVSIFSLSSSSRMAKIAELRRLVERLKPEVVHSYSFYTNLQAWCGTLGTQSIAVGSVRSDFHHSRKGRGHCLGRLSARWPRHQIFISLVAAEQAQNYPSFFSPKRIFVIRIGVDLQYFTITPPPNSGRPQVIGIGSLRRLKRWDRLLRAALDLKRKDLDFFIRIAGDGPLRDSLERQAEEFGLQNYVEFIGHTDSISEALAKANFLVHTSDFEGGPNVVLEAMACGRAVVATDVGSIPDFVDDGKTGFVVRRGDDAALVERMKILITNAELCQKMGELGRAKAESEFGLDRMVNQTLAAYRAVGWKDN